MVKKEQMYIDKAGIPQTRKIPLVCIDKKEILKGEILKIKIMSDIWTKEIPKKDGTKFNRYGCYGFLNDDTETVNFEWGEYENKQFKDAKVSKFDEITIYIKPIIKETLYYMIEKGETK